MTLSAELDSHFASIVAVELSSFPGGIGLTDFPYHWNVGDSAIWLGERRALEKNPVVYLADSRNFRGAHARKCDLVLLHGGGSVGTRWPRLANHREEALAMLSGRAVVQLPQTADMQAAPHLRRIARLSEGLSYFRFLARDSVTADMAESCGIRNVSLCPDPAFGLKVPPKIAEIEPAVDVLLVLRRDHESQNRQWVQKMRLPDGFRVADWRRSPARGSIDWARGVVPNKLRRVAVNLPAYTKLNAVIRGRIYDNIAQRNVESALELISSARVVITDRLHGHVLAEVLGRPHVVLDTVDAKIGRFRDDFTLGSRFAVTASELPEAIEVSKELLS